ncbi:MAG: hypothetical protein GY810_21535 [Aureispira sp.]|nr:hypothetical protein [Aureispira sp.]
MLIKQIFCFLVVSLVTLVVNAQDIKVSEAIDISREVDYRLIEQYKDTLLMYRRTRTTYAVEAFDTSLTSVWKKELDFDRQIRPIMLVSTKKDFTIIYYYYQKGNAIVRARKFNSRANMISDAEVTVFSNRPTIRPYQVVLSDNKKYLNIYTVNFEGDMQLALYNIHTEDQVWKKNLALIEDNYYKEYQELLVNNKGETFLIFDKNNIRRKRENHHYLVYFINKSGQKQAYTIPFNDYLSYDVKFTYDELNNQLIAGGLYGENSYHAQGLFYARTRLKKPAILNVIPFEEEFMRSLTGEKRKKLEGVHNFVIQELILRRDGGVIVIGEQHFKYEYQSVNMFFPDDVQNQQADYLYENMFVASVHPNGEIHWKKTLFKSQSSENDNAKNSSFFSFKTKSNIRLLYNDKIRWGTGIYEYIITGKGDIERNNIRKDTKHGVLTEFMKGIQVNGNQFLGTSERGTKLKIVRITY